MAPSSSRARNAVMKIAERSSLKILPSPNTTVHSHIQGFKGSNVCSVVIFAYVVDHLSKIKKQSRYVKKGLAWLYLLMNIHYNQI